MPVRECPQLDHFSSGGPVKPDCREKSDRNRGIFPSAETTETISREVMRADLQATRDGPISDGSQRTASGDTSSGRAAALRRAARSTPARWTLRLGAYLILGSLTAALLLIAISTVPVMFGYHTYRINSETADLNLRDGTVAVTKPTQSKDLELGDIIAYSASDDTGKYLYRIIESLTIDGERTFTIQRQINNADSSSITIDEPVDRLVYRVRYAGHILAFADRINLLVAAVALVAVALYFVRARWRSKDSKASPGKSSPSPSASDAALRKLDFQPGAAPLGIELAAVPSLHALMKGERALTSLPATESATLVRYHDESASLEVTLRAPLAAAEIVEALRSAGLEMQIEEARPKTMEMHLRRVPAVVETSQ